MASTSTGVIRSNALSIYISTTADAIGSDGTISGTAYWDLVANSTSGEISLTRNVIDVSDKGSKGREHLLDFVEWTLTCEAQVRYDGTMPSNGTIRNSDALTTLFTGKTRFAVAWTTGQFNSTPNPDTADPIVYGYAYITEMSESAGLNDVATISVTIQGEGEVYTGTIADNTKFQVPTS